MVEERAWKGRPKRVIVPYFKLEISEQYPEYGGTREIPLESRRTTF